MIPLAKLPDEPEQESPHPLVEPPLGPTEQEWLALSTAQRERLEYELIEGLNEAELSLLSSLPEDQIDSMAEGDIHHELSDDAWRTLRTYFRHQGRSIYVAVNKAVSYPRERGFSPDLLAVTDVALHPRDSWIVARERKGLDLALEICKRGDRRKDLVDNVIRYARLGIREYFVLDVERRLFKGYRLPSLDARRYQPLQSESGRLFSQVLGLHVAYLGGRLRFIAGNAELLTADEENARLVQVAQEARQQAEEEAQRAEAEAQRADRALKHLSVAILSILHSRGLACSEEDRARIAACRDLALLERWLQRASVVATPEELFLDS